MKLNTDMIAAIVIVAALFVWGARWAGVPNAEAAKANSAPDTPQPADSSATPVLVELFTSEGCSSCPPADALLTRLGKTQPVPGAEIIALEEHVDYWDRLGWKDPFSSEAATARQGEYAEAFGGGQVYTPQMVVDGHAEFVGSSDSEALRAIRSASQAAKPAVHLAWQADDTLSIQVDASTNAGTDDKAQVFLVVAENMLHSDVRRGENAGRALEHNGVVRQLLPVGKMAAASQGFSSKTSVHSEREWNRADLRAIVFVQSQRTRRVLAAGSIPFPGV